MDQRETWKTRAGFFLAAVGSAVGLGNIWRFPYMVSEHGGAAFVLIYVGMMLLVGIPVMVAELHIGRSTRKSPVAALVAKGGPSLGLLGGLFVLTGFVILAYYSVIAGWCLRYLLDSFSGASLHESGAYFERIATGKDALLFHAVFMGMTIAVVACGVTAGIERCVKLMIPLLFLLLGGMGVWALFLPGAAGGYAYYLKPSMEELLSLDTLSAAAGHTFFSLSLGMGVMITYASYLEQKESLLKDAAVISFADFGVAFFAGLVVFPIVFALGIQDKVGESTVGTLFIAIPEAFAKVGGAGKLLSFAFFLLLVMAALTSAISILEVVAAALMDSLGLKRIAATLLAGLAITLLGVASAFSLDVLSVSDAVAGTVLLIVGGLMISVLVGWFDQTVRDELSAEGKGVTLFLLISLRVVAPLLLFLVLSDAGPKAVEAVLGLLR